MFPCKTKTIYIDNVYSSVSLTLELQKMQTYLLGTLRKKTNNHPPTVLQTKLQKYESISLYPLRYFKMESEDGRSNIFNKPY